MTENAYLVDGKLHRANGPALDENDIFSWWLNGERHRYYGYHATWGSWYIHGKYIK